MYVFGDFIVEEVRPHVLVVSFESAIDVLELIRQAGEVTIGQHPRTDDELFAFAGLWETWGSNGDELRTVTIITTEPNAVVESIHDRMPVMLEREEERRWLEEDDPDELEAMLDPGPDDQTGAYEISTKVNDPSNDLAEIIEPLGHGQSGLGQFS